MLGPAGLRGKIGVQLDLRFRHDIALQIEEQGADALRAIVDGENEVVGHGGMFPLLYPCSRRFQMARAASLRCCGNW